MPESAEQKGRRRQDRHMAAENFDFDTLTDRRSTYASKWEIGEGELPMWIADMDFKAAPAIRAALQRRLDNGIFGYTEIPDVWYEAYMGWWKTRHHLAIQKESLVFCTGVIPAISTAVRKLTTPAENVLILTPVYNIFYNSILNNGRRVLESQLTCEDGAYRIDWADFEEKLADPQTSLMIFCNPHNPVGKIWDIETLQKIGALCEKYGVTVISDEIHCDITDPGKEYVPFASASETCAKISVTCIAPTKCFNLAGLQTAAVMVPDPFLRHKMWRGLNTDEVAEPNAFAIDAATAAFNEGGPWLDAMRAYTKKNKDIVRSAVKRDLPQLCITDSEATYLLWIDCGAAIDAAGLKDSRELAAALRKKTGLILSDGCQYGPGGERFLRMNTACPRKVLEDGLARFIRGMGAL